MHRLTFLVLPWALALACVPRGAPPPAEPPAAEPAKPAIPEAAVAPVARAAPPGASRLEVLPSSWSTDEVTRYMKTQVAPALGVRCDHCHVEDDFASDANPKKGIARDMMRMVADLNAASFGGQERVTCMTCHGGKVEPRHP
jgi:hypothetical protein